MNVLLPFHPDWTGSQPLSTALTALAQAGITGLELNLPPSLQAADGSPWRAIVALAQPQFDLHLHAPLPVDSAGWPLIAELAEQIGGAQSTLIVTVHAPRNVAGYNTSIAVGGWLRTLADTLPAAKVALELGWNWSASRQWQQRWHRWRRATAQRSRAAGRPQGVGSGLGHPQPRPEGRLPYATEFVDPPLAPPHVGSSVTDSRAGTLAAVVAAAHPRVGISWDLAHDWLGGPWSDNQDWATMPSTDFLAHLAYVRVHDATTDGHDHLPLVAGNVPYTTQLRGLQRTAFDGPVCLAVRYTAHARRWGPRAELQARSLQIIRQALRIV